MFVKFLIVLGIIGAAGPGVNEGGFEVLKEKGPVVTFESTFGS